MKISRIQAKIPRRLFPSPLGATVRDFRFDIPVESLRGGLTTTIEGQFAPDFLEIAEKDLIFKDPIHLTGEAYVAGEELLIHVEIKTLGWIPCSICNEPVHVEVVLPDFYHAEPLSDIKGGVFNFREVLREAILLETPHFAECNEGMCPKRKDAEKFLTKQTNEKVGDEEGHYHPFAGL